MTQEHSLYSLGLHKPVYPQGRIPGPRDFAPKEYRAELALRRLSLLYRDCPEFMRGLADIHSLNAFAVHFMQTEKRDLEFPMIPTVSGLADLGLLPIKIAGLEDGYFDGEIAKDRYLQRRDDYLKTLEEIESKLSDLPTVPRMDIQPVLGIMDTITWDTLDDQAWREIIEGVVDRVVVEGSGGDGRTFPSSIKIIWKSEFQPLLDMVTESIN